MWYQQKNFNLDTKGLTDKSESQDYLLEQKNAQATQKCKCSATTELVKIHTCSSCLPEVKQEVILKEGESLL